MPVDVQCPSCGKKYVLADDLGGTRVACVQCHGSIEVPDILPATEAEEPEQLVPAPEPPRHRRFLLPVLFLVGTVIASAGIVAAMVLPRIRYASDELQMEQCAQHLRRIGEGMLAFALEHNGKLPYDAHGPLESLAQLYPRYVDDPVVFVCPEAPRAKTIAFPSNSALAGHGCSYLYDYKRAGGSLPASGGRAGSLDPDTIIMTDSPESRPARRGGRGGGNVLCADGHVEWRDKLPQLGAK